MTRLFEDSEISLGPDALILRGFASDNLAPELEQVITSAPFRHMITPSGFKMSVGMTNCGALGWVTDRKGYRYSSVDPESGKPWPPMPPAFLHLARNAAETAGFPNFVPDACLINRYAVGAKMSLHQDKDERDLKQPIVSVSLGLTAVFQFGGLGRRDPVRRVHLEHGDVAVWGGASRLAYHGVMPLKDGVHPDLGACRINLTFRRAS
jgi:alkylated DNA repair protein (DNA oxidative demethylase)